MNTASKAELGAVSSEVGVDTGPAVELGIGSQNRWAVSADHVDLSLAPPPPMRAHIAAEPQNVTIDLHRTAMIVVDMQNDFCAPGGWCDYKGADLATEIAPIEPLSRLLPVLRGAGVPIVWVNWGNRPDKANLAPNLLHAFNPTGAGINIGDAVPGNQAPLLQKDSWGAAIVDGLQALPGDIHVDKFRISGFWDTPLDSILRNLGVTTLLFAGVNTDQCVFHTLTDANFNGFACMMLEDCCGTTSPAFCTESTLWNVKKIFGFVTGSSQVIEAVQVATV
ncbi:MAG: isochorismatase [Rhizobacter sp.]|nr:isochorismatase [Rhizobacter sp.]